MEILFLLFVIAIVVAITEKLKDKKKAKVDDLIKQELSKSNLSVTSSLDHNSFYFAIDSKNEKVITIDYDCKSCKLSNIRITD